MKRLILGFTCLTMLATTGCMTQSAGLAPSTTPITGKDAYTIIGEEANGRAYGVIVFGIGMGESRPSRKATDRAILKGGGNGLIEVTESNTLINLLYVHLLITRVTGTPVTIERGGGV